MDQSKGFECNILVRNDNFVVRDHRVHQVRIMPGVTFLDLIYKLLNGKGFPLDRIELRHILFKEAVATTDEYDKKLNLRVEKVEFQDKWQIKARSIKIKDHLELETEWTDNLECELKLSDPLDKEKLDVAALKQQCEQMKDMDEVYALARQVDIHHYDFMKGLGQLYQHPSFILAELQLGELAQSCLSQFHFHPAFLDCSTLIPFLYSGDTAATVPFIPLYIECFRALAPLGETCYVYVKEPDESGLSKDVVTSSYEIYDGEGRLAAVFHHLSAKRIRSKELITRLQGELRTEQRQLSQPVQSELDQPVQQKQLLQSGSTENAKLANFYTIEQDLCGIIAAAARISEDELDHNKAFYDQGLDSKDLLELVRQLEERLSCKLYPTLLFEYTNMKELLEWIEAEHRDAYLSYLWQQAVMAPVLPQVAAAGGAVSSDAEEEGEMEKAESPPLLASANPLGDIAIIGLAGKYPNSPDLDTFWQHVATGQSCITEVPENHWRVDPHFHSDLKMRNKTYSKWGGFIKDADAFDPVFFGIAPREAERLDPQLRVMLETAWQAVEDAGYIPGQLEENGCTTGVYVGVMNSDYTWVAAERYNRTGEFSSPGSYNYDLANRISYCLNFQGPSLTLETACASSLTAIHMARAAILNGECTTALAGGVNLSLHESKYLMLSELNLLSPDGRERTFDASANGYVSGEGAGMVLLKSLKLAEADGDHIYGIIKGSAVNHSGSDAGQHVPNVKALSRAAKAAMEQAGVQADHIQYIETHGTGTALGDPLELRALADVFGRRSAGQAASCAVGTKANFGHLESASGICSLTKVLLSMKHRKIPKCANVERINPAIPIEKYPFYIPTALEEWVISTDRPRIAGINSFGIGGSNAFLIVQEYGAPKAADSLSMRSEQEEEELSPQVIVLSARNTDRLSSYIERLAAFTAVHKDELDPAAARSLLERMAYTLQMGRKPLKERIAIVCSSLQSLHEKLLDFTRGNFHIEHMYIGNVKGGKRGHREEAVCSANMECAEHIEAGRLSVDLSELSRRWVRGEEIDWRALYSVAPRRISLPTYPFARDRYWIAVDEEKGLRCGCEEQAGDEQIVCLRTSWEPLQNLTLSRSLEPLLLFDTNDKGREALLALYKDNDQRPRIVVVKPGSAFRLLTTDTYELRPQSKADYLLLLADLQERGLPPARIMYLWGLDNRNIPDRESAAHLGFYSVLALTQCLMEQRGRQPVQLLYAYSHQLGSLNHAAFAGLSGLFKSLRLENPRFHYRTVAMDTGYAAGTPATEAAPLLWLEYDALEAGVELRYRNGKREAAVLEAFKLAASNHNGNESNAFVRAPFRRQGVYLITGGLGGIGYLFACHLAERVQAKLILTGRSQLTAEMARKLERLRELGSEAVYILSDISDQQAAEQLIVSIRQRFKGLNGVIHSAGVLRDGIALNKKTEDVAAVLAPKVEGSVLLDQATRNEALDFFVLFSSTAAAMGNFGQSDYAYANRFMDHFAQYREDLRQQGERSGRSLAIQWPLWREGGMTVDERTEQLLHTQYGMVPLDTATGLDIIGRALESVETCVAVLKGNEDKLMGIAGIRRARIDSKQSMQGNSLKNDEPLVGPGKTTVEEQDDRALLKWMEKDVLSIVSRVLKIKVQDIDMESEMSEFGFDSILLTQFSEELSDFYRESILPSIFFEHRNLESLLQYLSTAYRYAMLSRYSHVLWKESTPVKKDAADHVSVQARRPEEHLNTVFSLSASEPVAIIGMSGVMPQSDNLHEFWGHLDRGDDLITAVPASRWSSACLGRKSTEGEARTEWGGFMNEVDLFDPLFFDISPMEAEQMDPQQRIFIETVWKAIEDAGYKASQLAGTRTALFVGVGTDDYKELTQMQLPLEEVSAQTTTGTSHCILANRISYLLDIHGPSEPIDTACSSSLVAIHRAVEAIQYGNCSMAIAGGVNVMVSPTLHVSFDKAGMLSPDGRCKTFDHRANGYVRGEGAGALLLKPLSQAEADGDHIYGLIRGTEINHGGHANSLTAPNPTAQSDLLVGAYRKAGLDPATITYIEAHGTGTPLGDPVEINGLKKAFEQLHKEWGTASMPKPYCGLGSVKTNIGHLETAAGIAGVFKVLLAMKHRKLPKTLHLEEINPYIELKNSPFYIVKEAAEWNRLKDEQGAEIPRRAGVSSFGFGGVNAHVVIEEYDRHGIRHKEKEQHSELTCQQHEDQHIFILSAKNEERLKTYVELQLAELKRQKEEGQLQLASVAYTLQTGREEYDVRLAVTAKTAEELIDHLNRYVQGDEDHFGLYRGDAASFNIKRLLSGAAGVEFVQLLMREQDYGKLCELWTAGLQLDWNQLYDERPPQKIPLPTYPFARERYWLPASSKQKGRSPYGPLHPLLDGLDFKQSIGNGVVFHKRLLHLDPLVQDHRIHGRPALPGVGYMEMAYAAYASMIDKTSAKAKLSRVMWLQPLYVDESSDVKVTLSQSLQDRAQIEYEIWSRRKGETVVHGKGVFEPPSDEGEDQTLPVEALKKRCTAEISKQDFYEQFEQIGLSYGTSYQRVSRIWRGENEALSQITLSQQGRIEAYEYTMNPYLMDGALQTVAAIAFDDEGAGYTRLPFSVEGVELLHPVQAEEGYVYVKKVEQDCYHIAIADQDGRVCVKLNQVRLKRSKDHLNSFFYTPSWKLAEPIAGVSAEEESGALLLVSMQDDRLAEAVHAVYAQRGQQVYRAELAAAATNRISANRWAIESGANEQNALEEVIREVADDIRYVYVLSCDATAASDQANKEQTDSGKQQLSLFRLVKALLNQGFRDRAISFKVVGRQVYPMMNGGVANPAAAGLFGFTKSLAKEHPAWSVACIDIDDEAAQSSRVEAFIQTIMEEPGHPSGNETVIRNGARYARVFHPTQLAPNAAIPFHKQGVYLILGGAGGIGWELSRHLAASVQARMIWIGRTAMDERISRKIKEAESLGGKVHYIQADGANLLDMQHAIREARAVFGSIQGAFHSALVLHDRTIANMDETAFLEVLAPKVKGSEIFYEVLREEPLDFMMFFSSAQSSYGSAGQSNYAGASAFQDMYALNAGQGANFPIKVVNWGYWGEVGIVATKEYKERLLAQGIRSIRPAEGMEAIRRILLSPAQQLTAIKADGSMLEALGIDNTKPIRCAAEEIPSLLKAIPGISIYQEMLKGNGAARQQAGKEHLSNFASRLLLSAMQEMKVFRHSGEQYEKIELRTKLSVIPFYHRLFSAMLAILAEAGFIEDNDREIRTTELVDAEQMRNDRKTVSLLKEELVQTYPEWAAHAELLWTCIKAYPAVLIGQQLPVDVLFPSGSTALVERIYQGNELADAYNRATARMIVQYIEKRLAHRAQDRIRIVEVGAGTGGTSRFVLEAIAPYAEHVAYDYTDISRSFAGHMEREFGGMYPFVEYRTLNISENPLDQGYMPHSIDILFGSNVLHATPNMNNTLQQIKSLLKKNGLVLINEVTQVQEFLTLTFGLMEGWWLYEDEHHRLPNSPLLGSETWKNILDFNGYRHARVIGDAEVNQKKWMQSLIVAESNGEAFMTVPYSVVELDQPAVQAETDASRSSQKEDPPTIIGSHLKSSKQVSMPVDLREQTLAYLTDKFSLVLKIRGSRLNPQATFETFGVDSLVVMEIMKQLEKDFGKLPSTLLFEQVTLKELTDYMLSKQEARLKVLLAPSNEDGGTQDVFAAYDERNTAKQPASSKSEIDIDAMVDEFSDEEVDSLLARLL